MRNWKVFADGQNNTAQFNTTAYAEGLTVYYVIKLSFLRPTSKPVLLQHDIEQIVSESLSAFLDDLKSELQIP